ncbi:ornithine cyclodeaminase family protein [Paraburkholderia silvatlantica]|uniref:L-arginine dehydrogenase n=1 Tax=Paraburkholderia silvatlantica TaxID=321895 RepID=A0ABR6FF96_9BURK|nr:L-arginine dehydrogenase [Paraburkholderia silvatlantica]PVY23444.1 ornithine cyclodeaminase [Paraburkholderia silvatlantica]PXW30483.1 ornithine cyclodeaminase [Paraburkholderia silvatlantica]
MNPMSHAIAAPLVVDAAQVRAALPSLDVRGELARLFASLGRGDAVQPPQTLTLFPQQAGDFITYLGVLAEAGVFGAKLSPYIVGAEGEPPIITAWTALMSMKTGQPLMWCDSALLTTERTAGTTALAVDELAPREAKRLAVIGSGAVALAHIRHVAPLRPWDSIRVFSPKLAGDAQRQAELRALDSRASVAHTAEACVHEADVVMLCTSSGKPVLALDTLTKPALITSISTNVAHAHELDPAALPSLDVYCDYRHTTPQSAGEMVLAAREHGWSPDAIAGDLAELVNGVCPRPAYARHAFFRSIGLGLEDMAVANALYEYLRNAR